MSDSNTTPSQAPDGSTAITDEQKRYTDQLGDGSPSGTATDDPNQDTDVASGGDPESQTGSATAEPTKPDDVDLDDGTDPDETPVENPSG